MSAIGVYLKKLISFKPDNFKGGSIRPTGPPQKQ